MTTEDAIFERYRGKQVLLDANLLLLLMIGTYKPSLIEKFKRTADYSRSDYDTLTRLLSHFSKVVTTPHLLTEVSNLSNALPEHLKHPWWQYFEAHVALLAEGYEPAIDLTKETVFNPFGLADASVQNARYDTLILTEDFRLSGFLRHEGIDVLNFRDLRLMV